MTTLKDRIAALQANSGVAPSSASSRSPSPSPSLISISESGAPVPLSPNSAKGVVGGTRLKDKIARFDRIGGAPVPRGSFGLGGNPNQPAASGANGSGSEKPSVSRSASLKVPRTFETAAADAPAPFETINNSQRTRSGSNWSTISSSTSASNVSRPSYLSPNYTGGDNGSYFSRSASLRSISPGAPGSDTYSPRTSPLASPRRALTADALANLPSSPSFRPNDITSSVATTNADLERSTVGGRASISSSTSRSVRSPSEASSSSALDDARRALDEARSLRGRTDTLTASSSDPAADGQSLKSSSHSISSRPSSESIPESSSVPPRAASPTSSVLSLSLGGSTSGGRPTTSYLAQAAAYFPPSKRQSVHLPASLPLFSSISASPSDDSTSTTSPPAPAPSTSSPPNATPSTPARPPSSLASTSSPSTGAYGTPSSYRPSTGGSRSSRFDEFTSPRTSSDTAFFTADGHADPLPSTTSPLNRPANLAGGWRQNSNSNGEVNSGSGSSSTTPGTGATTPQTPISGAVLDAFPAPPSSSSNPGSARSSGESENATTPRATTSFPSSISAPTHGRTASTSTAATSSSVVSKLAGAYSNNNNSNNKPPGPPPPRSLSNVYKVTPVTAGAPLPPPASSSPSTSTSTTSTDAPSSTTTASTSTPSQPQPKPKPRKKKPMLIPGKWINSDDEDEEEEGDEEERAGKGWARIIVSSRAR